MAPPLTYEPPATTSQNKQVKKAWWRHLVALNRTVGLFHFCTLLLRAKGVLLLQVHLFAPAIKSPSCLCQQDCQNKYFGWEGELIHLIVMTSYDLTWAGHIFNLATLIGPPNVLMMTSWKCLQSTEKRPTVHQKHTWGSTKLSPLGCSNFREAFRGRWFDSRGG